MPPGTKKARKLLFLGTGLFAIYIIITILVFSGTTQGLDAKLAELLNSYQGSTFTSLMVNASLYGREYFWTAVVLLMLVFGKRDTKLLAAELAALFVVGIVAGEIAKVVAFRERPYAMLGNLIQLRAPPDTDSSFPSGHALIVSIGALFAVVKFKPGWKARAIALLLTLEAGVVCYSRVYLGVHYPLDVFAGVLLAGTIVFVGIYVIERYLPRTFLKASNMIEEALKKVHAPELL